MPLVAVRVMANTPPCVGVPESTPVVLFRVTPVGSVPVSLKVGAGVPVAVTVKVPGLLLVNVVAFAEVMAGAAFTVKVKDCVASGLFPLVAVMVIGNVPAWVGVPESTPVVLLRVTPVGSAPVSLKVGAGDPVAVTVKVPGLLFVNVVVFAEVIAGALEPPVTLIE